LAFGILTLPSIDAFVVASDLMDRNRADHKKSCGKISLFISNFIVTQLKKSNKFSQLAIVRVIIDLCKRK